MRKWLSLTLMLAGAAHAELPGFYNQVDRVMWMLKDMDKTQAAWKATGLLQVTDTGEIDDQSTWKGKPASAHYRWAFGSLAGVPAVWAQATSGDGVFVDFVRQHGEGIVALLHRVPSSADLAAEIKRMESLGVGVVYRGRFSEDSDYVLFDTAREGKYLVGVIYDPAPPPAQGRKVTQYAFMVRDPEPVSKYWARLGWPEMSFTHPALTDRQYRGKPEEFEATLGWQRHGKVVYEWIIPKKGPSAWHDHLETHGEGVHHLALQVQDMDAAIAEWQRSGFEYKQGGGWGVKGQKGSGRFAYMTSPASGGVDIELLWNFGQ